MNIALPKPILNASVAARFRKIRVELAREPDHPEGDAGVAYSIVAPLDAADRIDPRSGASVAKYAESRNCGRASKRPMVISYTVQEAAGRSTTTRVPMFRTKSGFTSQMNASPPADMSLNSPVKPHDKHAPVAQLPCGAFQPVI